MSALIRGIVLAAFVWQQGVCCDGMPCCADEPAATPHDQPSSDHDEHDSHRAPHHLCVATHLVYVRGEAPVVNSGLTTAAVDALWDVAAVVNFGLETRAPTAACDHRTRSQGRSLLAVYRL